MKGKSFNIAIVVVYASKTQSMEEGVKEFYRTLENTTAQCKSQK